MRLTPIAVSDTLREVFVDFGSRLTRTLLLVVAIAMSVGALVAGLELGRTAAQQIGEDLASSIVNTVTVTVLQPEDFEGQIVFPATALAAARNVPMVECAGLRLDIEPLQAAVSRFENSDSLRLPVFGATSEYACALGEEATQFDQLDVQPGHDVAVLGKTAAETLGIDSTGDTQISIFGRPFTVIGILDSPVNAVRESVVIPYSVAAQEIGGDSRARLTVRTEPGAGRPVSLVLRSSIDPVNPSKFQITRIQDLEELRTGVDTQLGRLVSAVGIALSVVTTLIVSSSMITTVSSKTSEIGLRRAMGFSRGDIFGLFLVEGLVLGLVGGLSGAALGSAAASIAAIANGWTVGFTPWLVGLGLLAGVVICTLASVLPAIRAASIRPADALRVE